MANWNDSVESSNSSNSNLDTSHSSREDSIYRKRKQVSGREEHAAGQIGGMRAFLVREKLTLSPLDLSNPIGGITMHAKRQLLKYNEALGGVVLSFDQLKVNGDPRVLDSGYVLLNISVRYYVFSPGLGDRLKGNVTKVWEGRVACLVYGCFNASVELEEGAASPDVGECVDFVVQNVSRTKDGILAVAGLIDVRKKKRKYKQKLEN